MNAYGWIRERGPLLATFVWTCTRAELVDMSGLVAAVDGARVYPKGMDKASHFVAHWSMRSLCLIPEVGPVLTPAELAPPEEPRDEAAERAALDAMRGVVQDGRRPERWRTTGERRVPRRGDWVLWLGVPKQARVDYHHLTLEILEVEEDEIDERDDERRRYGRGRDADGDAQGRAHGDVGGAGRGGRAAGRPAGPGGRGAEGEEERGREVQRAAGAGPRPGHAKRTTIREGTVAEEVEVSITYDPNRASVTEARLDTGEMLVDRAMTAEELDARRQLNLAPPVQPLPFPGTPTSTENLRRYRHVDGHDTDLGVVCEKKKCTCEGDAIAAGIDPADLVDEKGGDDAGPRP